MQQVAASAAAAAQVISEGPYLDVVIADPIEIKPTVQGWVRMSVPPPLLKELKWAAFLQEPVSSFAEAPSRAERSDQFLFLAPERQEN